MKHPTLLLAALFTLPTLAKANDTSVSGIGGRWRIFQKEHPSIRMVSEKIDLALDAAGTYTTVADFTFQNNGPATTVQMGFPESGYGDIDVKSYKTKSSFTHFKTWVDGVPFVATRHFTTPGEETFDALWVKTVPFKTKQTHHVRVSYQSSWGEVSSFPTAFVTYDFTGGNWRGTVAKSVLTVHLDVPGTYLVFADTGQNGKPQFQRDGNDFTYTWTNWQAQQAFAFRFDTTLRNWLGDGVSPELGLPVNINAPDGKLRESTVGWLPKGVVRDGQTYVNMTAWLEWAQKGTKYRPKGVDFAAPHSFSVKDRSGTSNLFVPAATMQILFGAKFTTDLKAHKIVFD